MRWKDSHIDLGRYAGTYGGYLLPTKKPRWYVRLWGWLTANG